MCWAHMARCVIVISRNSESARKRDMKKKPPNREITDSPGGVNAAKRYRRLLALHPHPGGHDDEKYREKPSQDKRREHERQARAEVGPEEHPDRDPKTSANI